jgi:hypothetical protein
MAPTVSMLSSGGGRVAALSSGANGGVLARIMLFEE